MDYTLVFVVTFFWLLVLSINQNSISIRLKNLEAKLKLFNVNIIESNQDNDEKVLEDSINNISVENEIKLSDEDASENDSSALLQDTLVQNLNETNIQLVELSSNDKKDIEKMFIGNIFNKIGAIALLVGFAIFTIAVLLCMITGSLKLGVAGNFALGTWILFGFY